MKNNVMLVFIDIFIWVPFGILVGYKSTQLPKGILKYDIFPTNEKTQKRLQKYLKIRKWKDKLPEAGATFDGGVSKKQLSMKTKEGVHAFIIETRRAELVHIVAPLICPVYYLYNPWWLATFMFGVCIILNLPFALIQRFNRARCLKILDSNNKR